MPRRALKVCAEPRCPELTGRRHCPAHASEHERRRGTRQARGYTADHDALRRRWKPRVDAGLVDCCSPTCIEPVRRIQPGEPWDLGHTPDRKTWRGPEHSTCNRSEGGKAAHI